MGGLARRCWNGFCDHDLLTFASAIAFQIMTAIIPLAMFALALIGSLHLGAAWQDHLAPQVRDHVSAPVFHALDDVVNTGLNTRRAFWLSAGLIIAVWEMSGAMRAIMDALSRIYGDEDDRPKVRRYLLSFALAVAVGFGFIIAFSAARFGATLLPGVAGGIVGWLVAFVVLTGVVWMVLRWGPSEPEQSRWLSLGSALTVLGWLGASALFGLYVANIADYDSIFSSLGALFVLMTYLYLSAIMLLAGAQLDALMRGRAIGPSKVQRLRQKISAGRHRSPPEAGTPRPVR
jgi:membrane protein